MKGKSGKFKGVNPDFKKSGGLVPVVVQDYLSNSVLMLGYMNREAFAQTLETGFVTFFSRTKGRLWRKGESSGNVLHLKDVKVDCDNDTLLVKVEPAGPVCHLGTDTCFNERNASSVSFLEILEQIIAHRQLNPVAGSYTNQLLDMGPERLAQKFGEEAVELVIEAVVGDKDKIKEEAADVLYHMLVLLQCEGLNLQEVVKVMEKRHKGAGKGNTKVGQGPSDLMQGMPPENSPAQSAGKAPELSPEQPKRIKISGKIKRSKS